MLAQQTLFEDEDGRLWIEWSDLLQGYLLHTQINKWSVSRFKKYIRVFTVVMKLLSGLGISKVYAIPLTEQDRKWEELFGFTDTRLLANDRYVIMEYSNGT